jgi:hypothetical protein
MKKTVTSLVVAAAVAVVPAVGQASPTGSAGKAAAHAAGNKHKLKKCKKRAYSRYQGPDLNRALKKCKKKFG